MVRNDAESTCFVISPIGSPGSDDRIRSDQVFEHIITPSVEAKGFKPIRADQISEPGLITSQIIDHLLHDGLVVADLTSRNANVFYELAVRHMVRKPLVQIIQDGEPIPFDVAQSRTIHVNHRDLDSVAKCKHELIQQIEAALDDPANVDTPISVAVDLHSLRQSENPVEKSAAEIIEMLQELRVSVMRLHERPPSRDVVLALARVREPIDYAYSRLTEIQEALTAGVLYEDDCERLAAASAAASEALEYASAALAAAGSGTSRKTLRLRKQALSEDEVS